MWRLNANNSPGKNPSVAAREHASCGCQNGQWKSQYCFLRVEFEREKGYMGKINKLLINRMQLLAQELGRVCARYGSVVVTGKGKDVKY